MGSGERVGEHPHLPPGRGPAKMSKYFYMPPRPRLPKPVDYFAVSANPRELRRGQQLDVELTITDPGKVSGKELTVGLVCKEWHDIRLGTDGSQQPVIDIAHEEWTAASAVDPVQQFTFTVPEEAPFSFEGEVMQFSWSVRATQDRRLLDDPFAECPIWVLP